MISFMSKNKKEIERLKKIISDKDAIIEGLTKPLELKYAPGRETILVKFGDKGRGWIPSEKQILDMIKQIKMSGLDDRFNVLIFNYAVEITDLKIIN